MYPVYNEIRTTSDFYDLVSEYCILNQKMDIAYFYNLNFMYPYIFSKSVLIVKEIGKIIHFIYMHIMMSLISLKYSFAKSNSSISSSSRLDL